MAILFPIDQAMQLRASQAEAATVHACTPVYSVVCSHVLCTWFCSGRLPSKPSTRNEGPCALRLQPPAPLPAARRAITPGGSFPRHTGGAGRRATV